MPAKRRQSPQEKKIRSYQRDGRNAYGGSTGASRRGIPLRKRLVSKANRHATTQALSNSDAEAAERAVDNVRVKRWQKSGDVPLSEWLNRWNRRRMGAKPVDSPLVREAERRAKRSKRGGA